MNSIISLYAEGQLPYTTSYWSVIRVFIPPSSFGRISCQTSYEDVLDIID